jgi:hypothetical protein
MINQRGEMLAQAFGITPKSEPVLFSGYPESLVRLGLSLPRALFHIETKLSELVQTKAQYHYFPIQKLNQANILAQQLGAFYGFDCEIIDAKIKKPSVIVRRGKSKPCIPPKLLSQVIKSYDPSGANEYISCETSSPTIFSKTEMEYNGLYLRNVDVSISAESICKAFKSGMKDDESGSFFWMDDCECFTSFKFNIKEESDAASLISETINDTNPTTKIDPPNINNMDTNIDQANEDFIPVILPISPSIRQTKLQTLIDIISQSFTNVKVEKIIVSPLGVIKFESGFQANYKSRNISSFRIGGEPGWTVQATMKSTAFNF